MSQRFQPVFYFLSALLLALLFFLPFASFYGDFHTFDLFGYGVTSPDNWDNGASPFSLTFSLPILILTITAMVLGGYLAMGLFRAVKLAQFQKLLKTARIAIIVMVACVAAYLGYSCACHRPNPLRKPKCKTKADFHWGAGLSVFR